MNSPDLKNAVCRICLDENVMMDWNNALVQHSDITYKDCYYKYTQLECPETELFSSMLCHNCLNGLENTHSLIMQAFDSHNFLLDVNCNKFEEDIIFENDVNYNTNIVDNSNIETDAYIVDDINIEDDETNNSTEFETVLVEKTDTETEDYLEFENSDEDFIKKSSNKSTSYTSKSEITIEMCNQKTLNTENSCEESDIDQILRTDSSKRIGSCRINKRENATKSKSKNEVEYQEANNSKKLKITSRRTRHQKRDQTEELEHELMNDQIESNDKQAKAKVKKKKLNSQNTPSMCSVCSKILHNKYSLQKHEKTHLEHRERKAACPICGVKFFSQAYVTTHMHIHNENRIKKHKCEFCDKAFYEKGCLNVHRRMHLGTMIPCSLCSKEFFRQVDLDIHMNSHSAALLNSSGKKRSRYLVRCKYCDKNILSTSYKSHEAAHLNEPLMKCSICDKEFFRRETCTQHLKSVHQKTTEEYNDFIVSYRKNRLSHLYLEQTAEIIPNDQISDHANSTSSDK